jgi:hypothetical protein
MLLVLGGGGVWRSLHVSQCILLSVCRKTSSITWRVPSYPFVSVACSSGDRMYVRLRSEEYFEQQVCGLSLQAVDAMHL